MKVEDGLDSLPKIVGIKTAFGCRATLLGLFCLLEENTNAFKLLQDRIMNCAVRSKLAKCFDGSSEKIVQMLKRDFSNVHFLRELAYMAQS